MNADRTAPGPSGEEWDGLLRAVRAAGEDDSAARTHLTRWLADHLPEAALRGVVDELSAEQTRRRTERCEAALAHARAALERGDLPAAQQEAETACHIDPISWEAHRLLGEVLERRGDTAAALRRYVTALHLGWESDEANQAIRRVSAAA